MTLGKEHREPVARLNRPNAAHAKLCGRMIGDKLRRAGPGSSPLCNPPERCPRKAPDQPGT